MSQIQNSHLNGSHHFHHKQYEKEFLPVLEEMKTKHHLMNVAWTEECWIDDEGEQLDYLIKADNLTSEQVVELSIEIEEKLNFSLPVNVTVRFSSHG